MHKYLLPLFLAVIALACQTIKENPQESKVDDKLLPYYEHALEKNFPEKKLHIEAFENGKKQVQADINNNYKKNGGFDKSWTTQGPGNIGARINTVAVDPNNEDIIFVGFAGGGLWRTKNGGNDWESIFDDHSINSIGHITIDESDSNTIYLGTGDPNIPGLFYLGNGVFKSTDGGDTWTNIGLKDQKIISKVRIDPTDDNILYASSMGQAFTKNETRGLYKSTNGGIDWERVFFLSDSTGVSDLAIHPDNPNIIHIATWDRVRSTETNIGNGFGSGIFRSVDGGENWSRANGIPAINLSRTGVTICQEFTNNIYVVTVSEDKFIEGIYRSEDFGEIFYEIPIDNLEMETPLGGFGWYFGKIEVNPKDPEHILILGIDLWETYDAGETWDRATPRWWSYEVHADKHDLDILPNGNMYLATDGGLYKKEVGNFEWEDIESIPTTQFYRVAYNPHEPNLYFGGAQDNGTTGGNAATINEWPRIYGGDGFQPVFNPSDPDHWFAEYQSGNIVMSTDGGESFIQVAGGISGEKNWNMPYLLSKHNNLNLYAGAEEVFKATDSYFPEWQPISENLTTAGPTGAFTPTIVSLDESPIAPGFLYAGTNNGLVWSTQNDGNSWNLISDNLPSRYISSLKASPSNLETAYVTLTGYRNNDNTPRVYRTDDFGGSWIEISSNLPNIAVNDIIIPEGFNDQFLFVATDGGVYGSIDFGDNWERLGTDMPNVPVLDMDLNLEKNELIAATFGRSIMTYPLEEILIQTSTKETVFDYDIQIYPNPVEDFIYIKSDQALPKMEIEIYNTQGQKIKTIGESSLKIPVSELESGPYILKFTMEGRKESMRFVKM